MNENPDDLAESRIPCSRSEAAAIGVAWIIAGHAVVCCVSVSYLALIKGGAGFFGGLLVAAMSWGAVPFVLLPVGYACGDVAHRLFANSTIPVPLAVRVFAVLFEFNLFAWVVMMSLIS